MATYYDNASLVMIPSGYKDDKLYSIKPTNGDGDFTFSRDGSGASPATRVNASGLIEKGRNSFFTYNTDFTNAVWTKQVSTIVANQIANPINGVIDADLFYPSNTGTYKAIRRNTPTAPSTAYYGMSVYAKAQNKSFIHFVTSAGTKIAAYDLSNGTISNGVGVGAAMENLGSGWYRCSVSAITEEFYMCVADGVGSTSVTANGTDGVYIWGVQLEYGITTDFLGETTTTAVSAGLLGDMPRLDYSGGATCPSLLLEPSRSNVVLQSEYYNTYWNINDVTIEDNSAISPEGVQNASKLSELATNARHRLGVGLVVSATTGVHIASVFMKKGTARYGFVHFGVTSNVYTIVVDLEDGTITDTTTSGTIAYQNVEDYGNGWYRCSVGGSVNAFSGNYIMQIGTAGSAEPTYNNYVPIFLGNTSNNIYVYGAQLEAGSYPTSYIPTYGSASTRGKGFGSLNLTSITSGLTEGTLYVEFEKTYSGENTDVLRMQGSSTTSRAYIYNGGFGFAADWATSFNYNLGENTKAVWRINSLTEGDVFFEGAKGTTGSGTAWSDIRYLYFNNQGGAYLKIKQVVLFPTALTDAECIALTTI